VTSGENKGGSEAGRDPERGARARVRKRGRGCTQVGKYEGGTKSVEFERTRQDPHGEDGESDVARRM